MSSLSDYELVQKVLSEYDFLQFFFNSIYSAKLQLRYNSYTTWGQGLAL